MGLPSGEKMSSNNLDREWIVSESRRTGFSIPTIEQLIEVLKFQGEQTAQSVKNLISHLQKPQKWYSIRINPIRDYENQELVETLHKEFNSKLCSFLPNVHFLPVEGPFFLKEHDRKLTVDKFAAESMMTGANLYIPGFIKPLPKFQKGENFSIYGLNHTHVANGIAQHSHKVIMGKKHGIGIQTTQSRFKVPSYRDSPYYTEGVISDHSLGPLIACNLLMDFYDNEQTIFDVCSAPGHKTSALSEIGFRKSKHTIFPKITSIDRSSKRLETLRRDLIRLGLQNIQIIPQRIEKLASSNPELINAADLLIMDPPCSALGTRPKLSISHTEEDFRSFFLLQRRLVKEISPFLKENGILLYTTCTLTLLENEGIVSLMKRKLGFEIIDAWRLIQAMVNTSENTEIMEEFSHGISRDEYLIQSMEPSIHKEDLDRYLTIDPHEAKKLIRVKPIGKHSTGYFIALLKKTIPSQ